MSWSTLQRHEPDRRQPRRPGGPERLLARHAGGNTLYLGGQTALDAEMQIVPGGIVEQFRQAFANVLTTLAEAGAIPEDLVSITIYLTDIPDYQAHGREIGRAWRELAGPVYPAMAGIGTTALWQPEALIEIVGVAVIPDERLRPQR